MNFQIRALTPSDVDDYRALRLSGMLAFPELFSTSHAEEQAVPLIRLQQRLLHTRHQRVFGAVGDDGLLGIACLRREQIAVVHDHARIWGVYVAPEARRAGVARALMAATLAYAHSVPELARVSLMVGEDNGAARTLYGQLGFRLAAGARADFRGELEMLLPLRA